MTKKTNWDIIKDRQPQDTTKYRDVYDDQQLERSKIEEKQSPLSRIIATVIVAILAGILMYMVVGGIRWGMNGISAMSGPTTEAEYTTTDSGETILTYDPNEPYNYVTTVGDWGTASDGTPLMIEKYTAIDQKGDVIDENAVYDNYEDVPEPEWYTVSKTEYENKTASEEGQKELAEQQAAQELAEEQKSFTYWIAPALYNWPDFVGALIGALLAFAIMYPLMMRNLAAQNLMNDTTDINQYQNDQHIALPEEIMRKFDWFPDAGAHCSVQVSSMISHVALQNKGIKKVPVSVRADKDILDEDGDVEYLKGEILLDDNDKPMTKTVPMFNTEFMEALFDASGLPKDKLLRKYYDATKIPYNPKNANRDKLKGYDTVADMINGDWEIPYYETQRPGGAYLVDIDPVNTMVLAITRAGKGQTIIEPTIDMWTREKNNNNMVINDPKGELLKKFYVPGTYRGFQVVQFNLINSMNTDIYNPLMMAATAAREGDFTKVAMYVNNIAEVFFPVDGGDDPVWPNAANNAFKRAAYGLIDYYLEEEKELRLIAQRTHMDEKTLETKLDKLWGHVTLYNCYELFVTLTSKKLPNPAVAFTKEAKEANAAMAEGRTPATEEAARIAEMNDEQYEAELSRVEKQSKYLWEENPEIDLLTLYFNATKLLPRNQMRTLLGNADDALRSMGGAEKMMASVYGIAITAMSFFTDPTIRTLTSGTPMQNVDLAGLSFPRRLGFRMSADFIALYHLKGMQCIWQAFSDPLFKESLGKDFYHEDLVNTAGWSRFYFKGIFPKDTAYLRCEIRNPQTFQLMRTFYFKFVKTYQTSLDGRTYVKDPILGNKIIHDGILTELRPVKNPKTGATEFKRGYVTYKAEKMKDIATTPHKETVKARAITQYMQRYSEKQKMVFLVTPPHLMSYAKLILILIKQLVDLNFDQSYMTKDNQKPLYKTRFMLDELGNLQSEGHGISGFETMLSIGLGQEQQFTLILQTLQQLRDVYGDSVDKIVQGNTSNIVFLKSTDDSMLDTLQKMSGTQHRAYTNSKTITRDTEKVWMRNEGKVSYTMTTVEEPVIKYNDMAFISERNSIIFRAGDSPIWNRNETILPMSWRLFSETITQPGHKYTFQTIPTLSSAKDFDVRKNVPDFDKMLDKRIAQALAVDMAREAYQSTYDYTEHQIEQLDPDLYADEIMEVINTSLNETLKGSDDDDMYSPPIDDDYMAMQESFAARAVPNEEQARVNAEKAAEYDAMHTACYADGALSPADFKNNGRYNHSLDQTVVNAFLEVKGDFEQDRINFEMRNGSLYSATGVPYIVMGVKSEELNSINEAIHDPASNVYSEQNINAHDVERMGSFTVTDAFLDFLISQPSWKFANGRFETEMARLLRD